MKVVKNSKSLKALETIEPILTIIEEDLRAVLAYSFPNDHGLEQLLRYLNEEIQEEERFLSMGYLYEMLAVMVRNAGKLGIANKTLIPDTPIMLMNISCLGFLCDGKADYAVKLASENRAAYLNALESQVKDKDIQLAIQSPFQYELLGDCCLLLDEKLSKQYYTQAKQLYGYIMDQEFMEDVISSYIDIQEELLITLAGHSLAKKDNHISRIIQKEYIASFIRIRHILKVKD